MLNANVTSKSVGIDFVSSDMLQTVKRFAQVIPAALATTLILVLGMQYLISSEEIEVEEVVVRPIPDPVMVEPPPIETVRELPEKPEQAETPPALPQLAVLVDTVIDNGYSRYTPDAEPIAPTLGGYSSDAPIATVLVQPDYPARAASRGIEGYVDVQFDVSPMGTTYNIKITGAQPQKVFNAAAIKAVQKWKFQPVRSKGEAVSYAGMEQRITFQMES